jgi:hypothetical protein
MGYDFGETNVEIRTCGGRPQTVVASQMLIMPANAAHALQAKQRFKILLVMIRG